MLKSIRDLASYILNLIAPKRKDFSVVEKLNRDAILSLPKALPVENMDWITPLWSYKDEKVRAIIWELKYRNNTLPLQYVGELIFDLILPVVSDVTLFDAEAKFLLLPIPITNERRSERGYNQSEYICRAIMENDLSHMLLYAPQWFQKIKETERQSHSQSREERITNIYGCFEANPQIEGKYIILIDDVVTTGTTLSEARNTLLSAGAIDVFAFTIAH